MHALVFLGVDNAKLHGFFDGKVPDYEDARSMEEAVSKAYKLAEKGDTVLLSPCCASFDLSRAMRIVATSSRLVCVTCKERRRNGFSK